MEDQDVAETLIENARENARFHLRSAALHLEQAARELRRSNQYEAATEIENRVDSLMQDALNRGAL
jgi:hypothetical protein